MIGIEENKPEAVKAMSAAIEDLKLQKIEVKLLKKRYPQGGEKQLIDAREKAHSALYELKQCCLEAKQPIKQNYFVDSWSRFGLTDKR